MKRQLCQNLSEHEFAFKAHVPEKPGLGNLTFSHLAAAEGLMSASEDCGVFRAGVPH